MTDRRRYTYRIQREDKSVIQLTSYYSPEEWDQRLAEHIDNCEDVYHLEIEN